EAVVDAPTEMLGEVAVDVPADAITRHVEVDDRTCGGGTGQRCLQELSVVKGMRAGRSGEVVSSMRRPLSADSPSAVMISRTCRAMSARADPAPVVSRSSTPMPRPAFSYPARSVTLDQALSP